MRDEHPSSPTPDAFLGIKNLTTLQIAGRADCDVEAFKRWLSGEVG